MLNVSAGVVTPVVKESSVCSNPAGEAAVASLESCLALSGGKAPVPLSAQQLVDCTLGLQTGAGTELSRSRSHHNTAN